MLQADASYKISSYFQESICPQHKICDDNDNMQNSPNGKTLT